MTPTPAQIARLLALPFAARQRLAEQEGMGHWASAAGHWVALDHLEGYGPGGATLRRDGWAWLPADTAALMHAATPGGCAWTARADSDGEEDWAIHHLPEHDGATGYVLAVADSALDCALTALEATYGGPDAR